MSEKNKKEFKSPQVQPSHEPCYHFRQRVRVGNGSMLASSLTSRRTMHIEDIGQVPKPDLSIYLDSLWMETTDGILTNCPSLLPTTPRQPIIVIEWCDGLDLDPEQVKQLVDIAVKAFHEGKLVEIGCYGGHGRTGTLLACIIARLEGLSAKEAIEAVRTRYCKRAVETRLQIQAVHEFTGEEYTIPIEIEHAGNIWVWSDELQCLIPKNQATYFDSQQNYQQSDDEYLQHLRELSQTGEADERD